MINKILSFLVNLILLPANLVPSVPIECTVTKVIDGDTCKVYTNNHLMTLRLEYIDAPELKQQYGKEAKDKLAWLILNRQVAITLHNKDKYGRYIAVIDTVNNGNINDWMLSSGHAWHYNKYDRTDKKDYHRFLEASARGEKLGLWQFDNPTPPWEYRK